MLVAPVAKFKVCELASERAHAHSSVPGSGGQFSRPRTTREVSEKTGASRRQHRPMTDIGVGGVTRTVARASDLSGVRRTEFLFYRFVVERRRRRRLSRHRRTVAVVVAVVAARHHNLQRSYTDTRQSPHTRNRPSTCVHVRRDYKRARTRLQLDAKLVRP